MSKYGVLVPLVGYSYVEVEAENRRKPEKVVNQYGVWDYKNQPEPYQPKGE